MDYKQYNALFSFIWNIANDLPNSRKNGYLIQGAYDNGGSVVGKDVGNVGGKNGGDNVSSFVPGCYKSVISLSQVRRTRLQVLSKKMQPPVPKLQP